MAVTDLDNWYLKQPEPTRGCLLALRQFILTLDDALTLEWKYGMPFFYFKGKMFCYFWLDKKTKAPYIGVVRGNEIEHPLLEQGNRARMKILRIDANADLPIDTIEEVLRLAMARY